MARPRDFQNRLPNVFLASLGRPLPPLLVEQTLTALLVDVHRNSFGNAPNRSSTYIPSLVPRPSALISAWAK